MATNHGVFVKFEDLGIRTLPDVSDSVILLVGTAPNAPVNQKYGTKPGTAKPAKAEDLPGPNYDEPFYISSLADTTFLEDGVVKNALGDTGGTLLPALNAIYSQGNPGVQIVIVPDASDADESWTASMGTPKKFSAAETLLVQKAAFLGIETHKAKPSGFGDTQYAAAKAARRGMYAGLTAEPRPRILAMAQPWVPDRAAPDVPLAFAQLGADLRGVSVIDGGNNFTNLTATSGGFTMGLVQGNIPSAYVVAPGGISVAGDNVNLAPYVAGRMAQNDADFNIARSPSNKPINGISDLQIPIDHVPGLATSRAQLLNNNSIATIIDQGGAKVLWGNELIHAAGSSGLKFITVTRVLNMLIEKLVQGMQWALANNISVRTFELIIQTVNAEIEKLVGQRIIMGGRCYADANKNVASAIKEGQAFFNLNFTPFYVLRELNISINITDEFLQPLLDQL